ncbi:SDR family NAD(P)-dependent oxidoreductase [Exiguobacterium sp. s142]|uniref:SDR family NAD(P)-dependent oxidoreductase n=1 Tax=Exiguobacterium sp. s142 TaxID=2751222 RepID=UPI001BEB6ED9|nr:SDR family NAD(P)-dependent oxidoreductase [Exiguobacterium sp. s142]
MKLALVTGASLGLGRAVAEELSRRNYDVINLSRSQSRDLTFKHIEVDLSDVSSTLRALDQIKPYIADATSLLIIQNAALIEPIHRAGHLDTEQLTAHVQANLLAPMLITNAVLAYDVPVSLIHVTSGAAKRPISGWSAYCGTKAGLDHFSETVALELEGTRHRLALFNPGVMDTSMQQTIRASSREAFQDVEQFQAYETEGKLRSPETVGRVLVEQLIDKPFVNGKTYTIHDLI